MSGRGINSYAVTLPVPGLASEVVTSITMIHDPAIQRRRYDPWFDTFNPPLTRPGYMEQFYGHDI